MKRIQISTSVSKETKQQADDLITKYGYSLRDVITLGIEKLYAEKQRQEVNRMGYVRVRRKSDESTDATCRRVFGKNARIDYQNHGANKGEALAGSIVVTNDIEYKVYKPA